VDLGVVLGPADRASGTHNAVGMTGWADLGAVRPRACRVPRRPQSQISARQGRAGLGCGGWTRRGQRAGSGF
jgi:hypothetical protein